MMKRFCLAGIVILAVLSMCAIGFAAADSQSAITLDGTKIEAAAYVDEGGVYLPLRAVCEALGYEVQWSGTDNTISVTGHGKNIAIDLNNQLITADDHVYYMSKGYKLIADRTYLGTDFFSANFGLEVRWDRQSEIVQLERVTENPISIKTMKEFSETEIIKITLQFPQIDGLTDKTVQDSINSIFKEAAMAAKDEGLKNADEMKKDRASGYGGSPNKCETYFDYSLNYNQNGLLSVVFKDYQYTGGAHGSTAQSSYTFNLNTGEEYTLKDLFNSDANYVSFISDTVRKEINERVKEGSLFEELTPFNTIREDHDFYLSDDGIVIYFQQYEYWPYAAGIQEFTVEYAALKDMLKPGFSFLAGVVGID